MKSSLIAGGAALVLALVLSTPLLALPSGTQKTPSGPSQAARNACKQHTEGTRAWRRCIRANSSSFKDEDLYWAGVTFAKAGDYEGALEFLGRVESKNDARVLTMIGYSIRKQGRVEEGIGYYHRALALDPNYVEAREYLGEGYLQQGDLEKAKAELAEIGRRCGVTCETYAELEKQIAEHEAKKKG
jgi:tetratricopeptide (TPR) repeat protein